MKFKERNVQRDEIRKYSKFKVEIDLHKLIVPGWTLDQGEQSPMWIEFKYERLPNICFNCGRFDHETRSCPNGPANTSNPVCSSKFGPWLRADRVVLER